MAQRDFLPIVFNDETGYNIDDFFELQAINLSWCNIDKFNNLLENIMTKLPNKQQMKKLGLSHHEIQFMLDLYYPIRY